MTKFSGFFIFAAGAFLGVLTDHALPTIQKVQESVPKSVTEAINAAKAGDDILARKLLEENLKDLDLVGTSTLIDLYALGLGGEIDKNKALALIRLLDCEYADFGEKEFYLSKLLVTQNAASAADWLLRSAEVGYAPALDLLSNTEKMNAAGFNISNVNQNYWAARAKKTIPVELIDRLTDCKIKK